MIIIKRKPKEKAKEKTKDLDFKIGDIVIFNGLESGRTSIYLEIGLEYEIHDITTNGAIRFDPRTSPSWYLPSCFSKKYA